QAWRSPGPAPTQRAAPPMRQGGARHDAQEAPRGAEPLLAAGAASRGALPPGGVLAPASPQGPAEGWPSPQRRPSTGPLRKGQVLVPSRTLDNDAQRVANSGRPISPAGSSQRAYAKAAQQFGLQVDSVGFPKPAVKATPFPEMGARPGLASRPGTAPGVTDDRTGGPRYGIGARHNSKVSLVLPPSPHRGPARSSSSTSSSPQLRRTLSRTGGGFLDPNAPVHTPTGPSPLWSELHPDANAACHPTSLIDPAKRAQRLLGTLSSLRRQAKMRSSSSSSTLPGSPPALQEAGEAGQGASEEAEAPRASAVAEETPEETLMHSTLRDLCDTCGDLQELLASLQAAQDPVEELGATRHPTALISGRTIAVVRRKAALLKAAEARAAQVQAALRSAEAMRQLLLRADQPADAVLAEAPEELRWSFEALQNIKGFIADHTHKDGDPAEANKSQFEAFAASFGLPAKHEILLRLRSLAKEAVDWWAPATLECAMREEPEEDIDAIKRMIKLAVGVMNEKGHDDLFKAEQVIAERACKRCVDRCLELFEQEEERAGRSNGVMPEMAKRCAEAIEAEIKDAVQTFGADATDLNMQEAKRLARLMLQEELERHAQKALRHARACREKDAAAAEAARTAEGQEAVPEVGLASALADTVDAEVERARKLRVPEHHAALIECASIAKDLRDQDGMRKRARARLERLAKQAAARAAEASAGPGGGG
ncbi:unnamed protein product, partial [Prorocentrum cordatum]